jgi:hypothetical protein
MRNKFFFPTLFENFCWKSVVVFVFVFSSHDFRNFVAVRHRHAARCSLPFAFSFSSRARHLIKNPWVMVSSHWPCVFLFLSINRLTSGRGQEMFELLLGPCYCTGFYTVQDLYIIYGWCIQNEKVGRCIPQCALMILKTCLLDYRSHSMLSFAQRFIRRCLAAVGRSLCNLHSLIHIYNYIFMCFYVLSLPTFYFRSIKFV